jgi:polar amino acid transport system substrate-binding protein
MWLKSWLAVLLLGCCSPVLATELHLYTEEYRPLSYIENGKLTGMAVEVVELLIQRTGQSARIELAPWTRGYHQVQREANSGLFSTVRTARREALFQWVGPIATGHTSFYARRGAGLNVRTLQDVERFSTLAVPKQWYSYEYLSDRGLKNLYGVPTPQHMMKMLSQQGMHRDEVELQFTFMGNNSYIAFSNATDPALVRQWQLALDELLRDGSLARIHQRWFSQPFSMPVAPSLP